MTQINTNAATFEKYLATSTGLMGILFSPGACNVNAQAQYTHMRNLVCAASGADLHLPARTCIVQLGRIEAITTRVSCCAS